MTVMHLFVLICHFSKLVLIRQISTTQARLSQGRRQVFKGVCVWGGGWGANCGWGFRPAIRQAGGAHRFRPDMKSGRGVGAVRFRPNTKSEGGRVCVQTQYERWGGLLSGRGAVPYMKSQL